MRPPYSPRLFTQLQCFQIRCLSRMACLAACLGCRVVVARAVVVERSRALATSSTTHHQEDYTRLGLPTSATLEEGRAAYFTKAKEVHPDLGAGREGEFQEVQEADPREDPRCREYWEMRKRCATKEQQKIEQ